MGITCNSLFEILRTTLLKVLRKLLTNTNNIQKTIVLCYNNFNKVRLNVYTKMFLFCKNYIEKQN